MSSIKERVAIEKERTDILSARTVHLYHEGNFYRAYDWSAWLCVRCINEFKVTKRQIKGVDSPVCFVGFPQSSTEKWLSKKVHTLLITPLTLTF